MSPTNVATSTTATTTGSHGTCGPVLTFGGSRRPDLDFVPRWGAFDRVDEAIALVEYRLTFLASAGWLAPSVLTGPEPIGRRSPLRDYEVLYIVRADLDDDKVQDVIKRVNTLIERSGGAAERTNLWGKRKLAYEVKHQKEGAYVLQDFRIDPQRIPELEAALKITEEVLRHLIVRKPEKAAPAPAVAPPPAEVILEPIAVEAEAVASRSQGDREEEEA